MKIKNYSVLFLFFPVFFSCFRPDAQKEALGSIVFHPDGEFYSEKTVCKDYILLEGEEITWQKFKSIIRLTDQGFGSTRRVLNCNEFKERARAFCRTEYINKPEHYRIQETAYYRAFTGRDREECSSKSGGEMESRSVWSEAQN